MNSVLEQIKQHVDNNEEIVNIITKNQHVIGVLPFKLKERFKNVKFFKETKHRKQVRYIVVENTKIVIVRKYHLFLKEFISKTYKNAVFYEKH